MPSRVDIHVGLPKTGTTYLQQTLWLSRDRLADDGVLVPGENHQAQRFAFWDLLGRRLQGVDQPRVPGAWKVLVETVRGWSGHQVVLSDEFLVNARPNHVRRIVRAFEPADVHVTVTVRDLARVIVSTWQQEVSKGRTWTLPEFVAAVRDPDRGPATAGVGFWLRHDLQRVLAAWETGVPQQRVHVVVVPPAGSPPTALVERYAAAIGLKSAWVTPAPREANPSVGAPETELLRRLNEHLDGRLNERQYLHMVNRVVKPVLRQRTSTPRIRLPGGQLEWLQQRTDELVELLGCGRYDVVGDPADLRPSAGSDAADEPDEPSDTDLAEAALVVLAATVEDYAGYWWRSRRRPVDSAATPASRVTSAARALGYQAKVRALDAADDNRVVAKAAQWYLRRSSGRR